jgi:hypothetical protein
MTSGHLDLFDEVTRLADSRDQPQAALIERIIEALRLDGCDSEPVLNDGADVVCPHPGGFFRQAKRRHRGCKSVDEFVAVLLLDHEVPIVSRTRRG